MHFVFAIFINLKIIFSSSDYKNIVLHYLHDISRPKYIYNNDFNHYEQLLFLNHLYAILPYYKRYLMVQQVN